MSVRQIKKGVWVARVRTSDGSIVEFVSRISLVDAIIFAVSGMGWEVVE
jgi:hypothetical protein